MKKVILLFVVISVLIVYGCQSGEDARTSGDCLPGEQDCVDSLVDGKPPTGIEGGNPTEVSPPTRDTTDGSKPPITEPIPEERDDDTPDQDVPESCLDLDFTCDPMLENLEPCLDFTCDSIVVQAILDINGLNTFTVDNVTDIRSPNNFNGRVNYLSLSRLGITILPSFVAKLSLGGLYIGNNKLETLPASIGKMRIGFFYFRDNQITYLPDEITEFKPNYIGVSRNRICSPTPLVEEWLKKSNDWDDGSSQICP